MLKIFNIKRNLRNEIAELTASNIGLQDSLIAKVHEGFDAGLHLQDQPFIPEYMEFEESIQETDGRTSRIYSRDGFCLTKTRQDLSENNPRNDMRWIVINMNIPRDENGKYPSSTVFLDSMYHAIVVLNGLGMNLPMGTQAFDPNAPDTAEEIIEQAEGEKLGLTETVLDEHDLEDLKIAADERGFGEGPVKIKYTAAANSPEGVSLEKSFWKVGEFKKYEYSEHSGILIRIDKNGSPFTIYFKGRWATILNE